MVVNEQLVGHPILPVHVCLREVPIDILSRRQRFISNQNHFYLYPSPNTKE